MSVVNQTLRELDARTAPPAPAAVLRPVAAVSPRRLGWAIGLPLVVAAVAAAAWLGWPRPDLSPVASLPAAPAPAADVAENLSAHPAELPVVPTVDLAEAPAVDPPQPSVAEPVRGGLALTVTPELSQMPPAAGKRAAAPPRETRAEPDAPPVAPSKQPLIQKRANAPSAEEVADARYRTAVALLQKGREPQARRLLEETLSLDAAHVPARQTLAALLSEAGRDAEAETVLRAGRAAVPGHAWFALSLARLEAARGDTASAIATLRGGLDARGVDADYHATLAALLVQAERPAEATQHYRQALAERPREGAWWAGLGLALAAQGRVVEAKDAYAHALKAGRLPEKLAVFVRAKLAE